MNPTQGHRPPSECPVCAAGLVTTRLGCHSCGTELVGQFSGCEFCSLDDQQRDLLRLFLSSRGNLREVGKSLGVSYPTARLRVTGMLRRLGLAGQDEEGELTREQVLSEIASGALTVDEGARLIGELSSKKQ